MSRAGWSRREFLRAGAAAVVASLAPDGVERAMAARAAAADRPIDELARDEDFWRDVQLAFDVDRSLLNLDNGAAAPAPRVVREAVRRYNRISNQAPVHYMWQVLEPNLESVRRALASEFGCGPEELAVTRGGSEALQIAQLGIPLAAGDEVVMTTHDYPRMRQTWEQRARRDRIGLRTVAFDVPLSDPASLVARVEAAFTPRTRVLLVSHVTHYTGQELPVADICRLARARGVQTIVDGSQAVGQVEVDLARVGCDYYGASLHKWMHGPVGTGFLYVRRERITPLWPLQPAPFADRRNIRKLEEVGTHPAAPHNALAAALAFHQALGSSLKGARLAVLRARWAERLALQPRVRILSDLGRPNGLGTFAVDGLDAARLADRLWDSGRILAGVVEHPDFTAVRVAPHLSTRLLDLDRFAEAVEAVLGTGPPA